jgi:branched-chain amino acid transport system substrate-binding protein
MGALAAALLINTTNTKGGWEMKIYLTTASLLFAGVLLAGGPALAQQGITDTEIVIGDVEPLTGPPALLGVAASIGHKIAIA